MVRKPIKLKNYQPTETLKSMIVLHYSEMNVDEQRDYFNNSSEPSGCAYMIGQNGLVYIMFHPAYYSNHIKNNNLAAEIRSIGIILEGHPQVRNLRGKDKLQYFTLTQLRSLRELCKQLRDRFKIRGEVIITKETLDKAKYVKSGIYLRDSFGDIDEFPEKSIKEVKKAFKP